MESNYDESDDDDTDNDDDKDDNDGDMTTKILHRAGTTNCSWASCREGCTADIFKCHQIR